MPDPFHFNFYIVGESSVGRTSFLQVYSTNQFDDEWNQEHMYDDPVVKELKHGTNLCYCKITDVVNVKDGFNTVSGKLDPEKDAIMLMYDITNEKSFDEVKNNWIKSIRKANPKVWILIIAHKSDHWETRVVQKADGESLITDSFTMYMEASAKTGDNVKACFEKLADPVATARAITAGKEGNGADGGDKKSACCTVF